MERLTASAADQADQDASNNEASLDITPVASSPDQAINKTVTFGTSRSFRSRT